ncbi:hypothetical protein [Haloarchaeobius amylolyticus]|uniref:hypothetical protein n=1 Tax=Haloarchaeobius amylolyticus TaxID=1198296 RepID=UPI0022714389|nr:hypothetical protein [Haloarchaeobius amylolyticus]
MPTRSGASHAASAFVMLLGGTYLKDYLKLFVDAEDIARTVESLAQTIAANPDIVATADTVSIVLSGVVVAVLAFVWGVAFHVKVL